MSRYPPATLMALTSEKDFIMSLRVVVEKAWMAWLELAGTLWWTTCKRQQVSNKELHRSWSPQGGVHTFKKFVWQSEQQKAFFCFSNMSRTTNATSALRSIPHVLNEERKPSSLGNIRSSESECGCANVFLHVAACVCVWQLRSNEHRCQRLWGQRWKGWDHMVQAATRCATKVPSSKKNKVK